MKLKHFSISQQGDSHIVRGENCQDYSETISVVNKLLGIEMAVAAIGDGVGSCDYSEDGSRIAVTTVLEVLGKELATLEDLSAETVTHLIRDAFRQADENIEKEASERELPYLLFDTTLTVTVLTEDGKCYVGHIGDDGAVALFEDGTYGMITQRIEGEEANSVIPLSSKQDWTFGVVNKPVVAVALMTDGLLDKSVGSELMNNRVYYPFFKPMFENIMENDQDVDELRVYWDDYLHDEEFRKGYRVTDDITLAIIQIPEMLKAVKPVEFDEEKWNRDTQETRRKIEKRLEESSALHLKNQKETEADDDSELQIENRTSNNSEEENQTSSNEQEKEDTIDKEDEKQKGETDADSVRQVLNKIEMSDSSNPPIVSEKNNAQGQDNKPKLTKKETTEDVKKIKVIKQKLAISPIKQKVTIGPRQEKKNSFLSKFDKKTILLVVAVVCVIVVSLISGNIGEKRGVRKGRSIELKAMQDEMAQVKSEQEEELAEEYQRGFEKGKQEALLEFAENQEATVTPQPTMLSPDQYVISSGQKGKQVAFIQKILKTKGWEIKVDAEYGVLTEAAVREFQGLNQLPSTGMVDMLTFWLLMNDQSVGKNRKTQQSGSPESIKFNDEDGDSTESSADTIQEQTEDISNEPTEASIPDAP